MITRTERAIVLASGALNCSQGMPGNIRGSAGHCPWCVCKAQHLSWQQGLWLVPKRLHCCFPLISPSLIQCRFPPFSSLFPSLFSLCFFLLPLFYFIFLTQHRKDSFQGGFHLKQKKIGRKIASKMPQNFLCLSWTERI